MKTRLSAAFALAVPLAVFIAKVVLAHAQLTSADPALGDTIKTPYTLTATYDDELTPDGSSIVIEDATGKTVANGTVGPTDAHTMTAQLPLLPDGIYQVLWTAVSADDKAVERGEYQFTISATASTVAPTLGATPVASSAPTSVPIDSDSGLAIPIVAALVVILAIAAFFIYRNRR